MSSSRHLSRRAFSALVVRSGLAGLAVPPPLFVSAMPQTVSPADSRIVRSADPINLEADVAALDSLITPVSRHYVRNHFPVPDVDVATWRLRVEGAVRTPLTLSLDDLQAMPALTRVVTLECAGNGRLFLSPRASGVQWAQGAVSTAEWTGVRVSDVFERAGLAPGALEVIADGLDQGTSGSPPRPAGPISFHRSLSLEDAVTRDALLAWAMNGAPLPPAHGFPLRLVVPGAYGMAAVKWLGRLIVSTERFEGYWQSTDYAWWDRSGALPQQRPLLGLHVKSIIASPAIDGQVARGAAVDVRGFAWSEHPITRVDVSTDAGQSWAPATLLDAATPGVWRRWRFAWTAPPSPGRAVLMARATDAAGRMQPLARNADYGSYVIDHTVPVPVAVA
jgi:DMSO/TMAO reductase YedYZ molybdopterin-dependent catalytic subunit